MSAFVTSQFNFCPCTMMSHDRTINNEINNLHERCLMIDYTDIRFSSAQNGKRKILHLNQTETRD